MKRDKKNPCDPVEAVVFLFRRLTDPENFHRVTHQVNVYVWVRGRYGQQKKKAKYLLK